MILTGGAKQTGNILQQTASSAAFTLIELLLVLAIVGLLAGAATYTLRGVMRSDLRSAASRSAALLRYAFDRATSTGRYYRIAFDIDKGEAWLEVSDDPVALDLSPSDRKKAEKKIADKDKEKKAAPPPPKKEKSFFNLPFFGSGNKSTGDAADDKAIAQQDVKDLIDRHRFDQEPFRRPEPQFKAEKALTRKRIKFPKQVRVKAIFTAHLNEPIREGQTQIYFFPQGFSEQAIIHLTDRSEDLYSIVLEPMSGRTRIYPCLYEFPKSWEEDSQRRNRRNAQCRAK